MAAREAEYESARLFAQQNRVTRLLYTLRDMNEFGLVVDFNRLQLLGDAGGARLLVCRLLAFRMVSNAILALFVPLQLSTGALSPPILSKKAIYCALARPLSQQLSECGVSMVDWSCWV